MNLLRRDFIRLTGAGALELAAADIASAQAAKKPGGAKPAGKAAKRPQKGDRQFPLKPRFDRFLPLSESFGYAGTGSFDMIIWLPGGGQKDSGVKLRLWMKIGPLTHVRGSDVGGSDVRGSEQTDAVNPEIELSGRRHRPVGKSPKDPTWIDFGLLNRSDEEFGNGFVSMRVFGLTQANAKTSWVVFTRQTEIALSGSVRDAERALCGIARDEVGRTFITPARAPVKTPTEFTLCYEAGPRGLPSGSLVRLTFPKAFSMPQGQDRDAAGWIEVAEAKAPVEIVYIGASIETHIYNDVLFRFSAGLSPKDRVFFRYKTDFTCLFPHIWREADRRWWWSELPTMAAAVAVD
ncbi:hypothetical protein FJY63_15275, partial [Candidatus Sumerlaeota bacterium]|nr:hypothetical protein [Candidatus Sumerlaeota bacterium]